MPIYAYRCDDCGHAKDVLQRISDPLLTVCPACGHEAFRKQVTAAGFQLKGSGWYVTDFRDKPASKGDAKADDGKGAAQADAKGDAKSEGAGAKTADAGNAGAHASSTGADKGSAPPAPAPATAPAPAPATPAAPPPAGGKTG